jgi:hypothetical protein
VVDFVGAADGFAAALEPSRRFADPTNYCPVLVGALAGVRWGAASVDPGSRAHCEILPRVREAAEGLAQGWLKSLAARHRVACRMP